MRLLLATLTLLALLPAHADPARAEQLMRDGKPADALAALPADDLSPAAQFWRGRALIELGRLEEASYALESVPAGHELSPYAARALIYCAWQSPALDFPALVAPLTESSDMDVSRLATAALAEYELRRARPAVATAYREFELLAESNPQWGLARSLMEIEHLRQQQRFDEALERCRALEADKKLPALAHQRARLALSEVYYAMEAAQPEPAPSASGFSFPGAEEEEPESVEGKGEETLLQFIASQPDSPLLEEAFRRLHAHGAFENSEYIRRKLSEWIEATDRPRRAALALRVRQYLLHRDAGRSPLDASCANMASSLLPREPMTAQILREQARLLLVDGKAEEARLYLRALKGQEDARALFYEASLLAASQGEALQPFLRSAELASEDLRAVALGNALLTALEAGDHATEARIMDSPQPASVRRVLLELRSSFLMPRDAARARRDLEEWVSLASTSEPPVDAVMDLAILDMADAPEDSLARLRALFARSHEGWSEGQELRLCSLLVEAARRAAPKGDGAAAAVEMARRLAGLATHRAVRSRLTLKLASMLSGLQRHSEALEALQDFVASHPRSPEAAHALLMAGHEARALGSLESLNLAIELYARCAAMPAPCAHRARLHQASVMARINRRAEARALIEAQLALSPGLSADERALAHCCLADAWALEGTDAGLDEAIDLIGRLLDSGEAPEAWLFRLRMLRAVLCSRRGLHEAALADYLAELERMPILSTVPSEADWFCLYFAGGGAIFQYMRLGRYAEAAALAERVAQWRAGEADRLGVSAPGPLAERFADWAASIRQVHPVE